MDSDTDVLSTYREELISYLIVYYYTEDAFQGLLLWKGHFRVNFLCDESRYTSLFILRRRSCLESFSLNIPGFCLLSFLVFFVGK